jgi:hypothetical protein
MKSTATGSAATARLETRIRTVPIGRLDRLPGNPRYMTSQQFERLTENIRRDGTLTSLPLVYDLAGDDSGKLLILSGNHRVDAAEKAGLVEIQVIEIVTRVSEEQRKAIALSHNAIAGQDDPNLLRAFYDGLSLALKEYSGITEDSFKAAKLNIEGMTLRPPQFEQVVIEFLPEVREVFAATLKRLAASKVINSVYVGRFADFNEFFAAAMRSKGYSKVHNAAMGLKIMADLAAERLDQLERAGASQEPDQAA